MSLVKKHYNIVMFKRYMFTHLSKVRNLKKSGDLLTITGNTTTITKVGNVVENFKLNSIDLANSDIKQTTIRR